jgi:hypothetical protein
MKVGTVGRFAGLLVIVVGVGCSNQPPTGQVSGVVRFRGSELTGGTVTFMGPNGQSGAGRIQANGRYDVLNAPLGENKIAVDTPPPEGTTDPTNLANPPVAAEEMEYFKLPAQFSDPNQSGLRVTVKEGKQKHDIDIE